MNSNHGIEAIAINMARSKSRGTIRPNAAENAARWGRSALCTFAMFLVVSGTASHSVAAESKFIPSADLVALDQKIDWSKAGLIAVQDQGRYKTLDSFARESLTAMIGAERLNDLSPVASLLEWSFNGRAYADVPVIYVKDIGVRIHFSAHLPVEAASRIRQTGYMSLRELSDPTVRSRFQELQPKARMARAMNRVANAMEMGFSLDQLLRIVPQQGLDSHDLWSAPDDLVLNLPQEVRELAQRSGLVSRTPERPEEHFTQEQAATVLGAWLPLKKAWLARDAAGVQTSLDQLAAVLPGLAKPGEYPAESKLKLEERYYKGKKFTWGFWMYLFGAVASIFALAGRWRWAFVVAQGFLLAGFLIHGYGLALRWQILERIPIANLFEAIIGSVMLGISVVLGIDLSDRYRSKSAGVRWSWATLYILLSCAASYWATKQIWTGRDYGRSAGEWVAIGSTFLGLAGYAYLLISSIRFVPSLLYKPVLRPAFLVAVNVAGFVALVLAERISPDGGALSSIRMILDDAMLRVHTTLITISYALIFLAAVIGLVYLFGYYLHTNTARSAETGFITAIAGISLLIVSAYGFQPADATTITADGYTHSPLMPWLYGGAAGLSAIALVFFATLRLGGSLISSASLLLIACATMAICYKPFADGMGWTMIIGGAIWAGGTLLGGWLRSAPQLAVSPRLATAGGPPITYSPLERPILAGGAPGDEGRGSKMPGWLLDFDYGQLILLNLVFVTLFVGVILGAVWADYSWGRPWGWDPKEVFAMNTWIIYAVLIHVRFIVKDRGLWTAWLSVIGCLMMIFNWVVVNLFIVGLHSYA